jgi:putative addiction module component (TIGR02574 family)|tara:strand:- start:391 stop:591 length:201 start_codon:yes stop_codon:yes gene_type:complete
MNLQELTNSEKILLAEDLWDSVASNEQLFPITEEQKTVLDKRLEKYSFDQDSGDSWLNVKNRISNT